MAPPSSAELPQKRLSRTVVVAPTLATPTFAMPPPWPATWKMPIVKPLAELRDKMLLLTIRALSLKMPPPRPAELADSVEPLTVSRPLALSRPRVLDSRGRTGSLRPQRLLAPIIPYLARYSR